MKTEAEVKGFQWFLKIHVRVICFSYSGNNLCRIKLNLWYKVLDAGTNIIIYEKNRASQVTQMVKNLPVMQETPVQFLGREDAWEKGYTYPLQYFWASLLTQMLKNPPAIPETYVWSLSQEEPLEKRMATISSILAWRIPWTEEAGRLQCMGFSGV